MASVQWEVGTDTTVMTTALDSLVDDANAISAEIDNSTDLYLFDDVEWHNAAMGYAPVADGVIELYCVSIELDGTGYEDGDATIDPPQVNLVGVFNLRAETVAQTHILRQIPISPSKYKYVIINKSGQTLASSGNTLKVKPYRYQTT
jgi:hypothetical protein